MNIKPGDLFQWVYMRNCIPVPPVEEVYTFTLDTWVTCAGIHLCISVCGQQIHWMTNRGEINISNLQCMGRHAWCSIRPQVIVQ